MAGDGRHDPVRRSGVPDVWRRQRRSKVTGHEQFSNLPDIDGLYLMRTSARAQRKTMPLFTRSETGDIRFTDLTLTLLSALTALKVNPSGGNVDHLNRQYSHSGKGQPPFQWRGSSQCVAWLITPESRSLPHRKLLTPHVRANIDD